MPTLKKRARSSISSAIRNRSFHIRRGTLRSREYLNLGCGFQAHPDFVNLDHHWNRRIDVCWDLGRDLPFADASMRGIYSEHCLEHLPLETADKMLAECFRILAPGGTLRLVVPDGELYLTGYSALVANPGAEPLPFSEGETFEGVYSPILSVNRIFREFGHRFIYDFAMLGQMLERRGFTDIERVSFRSGRDPKLLIDSENRKPESLYVDATAPA
jgi:predicted SAM-dependent methyltransferase